MNVTNIEWTATTLPDGTSRPGFTSNPIKYRDRETGQVVWACVRHSPGCTNCYAQTLALRYGRGGPYTQSAMDKVEPFVDEAELRKLVTAKTVGGVPVSGSRVFIGDMTDVFGSWVSDEMLDKMFAAFALRPDVTFQVLTKRADRMAKYLDPNWMSNGGWNRCMVVGGRACEIRGESWANWNKYAHPLNRTWPLPNVWLGTSVENQAAADERIPHLLRTPAAIRFISYEPALGAVDWSPWSDIDWIISGGESGPNARPSHPDWHRAARDFCAKHGKAYFFKQWGEWMPGMIGGGCDTNVKVMYRDGRVCEMTGDANLDVSMPKRMRPNPDAGGHVISRVGKKAAGRLLDGRVHDEFPDVAVTK